MKITLIGTGAYSLALGYRLSIKNDHKIVLWTEDKKRQDEFKKTRQIKEIFPDIIFPSNMSVTNNLEEAVNNTNLIFLVTSVKYINDVCKNIKKYYHNTPICIASKGIVDTTFEVLSEVVKKELHTKNIAVISGPTFAIHLINMEPVALSIAGNKKCVKLVYENLASDTLKLRISSDLIGIQLCGSIKNVFAISSGIINGLGYHESTEAFLINESLHEMKKLITSLGGKKKTILSFAGIGDLLLTCTSTNSRNYSYGYLIGSTKNKEKWQEYLNNNTVEGYYTLNTLYNLIKKKGIEIPFINILYNIVNGNNKAEDLIKYLIMKD